MKVLHFTTTVGAGGAETMLCNLVERLAARGVQNVVVSTTSSLDDDSLRPRIERSATFIELNTSTLLSASFLSAFLDVLRREKPDIVQSWMHTAGMAAGVLARLLGLRNVVWGIHSKDLLDYDDRPGLRAVVGRVLALGAHLLPRKIISCSRTGIHKHHCSYGYPLRKMVWIGNGTDTARFQPDETIRSEGRAQLGIPAGAPVIGMVSRFNPVKDIPTFLRAAALLQRARPDVHLVFCGDSLSAAPPEIASLALELPAPDRFHWIGFHKKTEKIYPLLDILTVTSVSEAYPMVLIEAMACGVPCVSTEAGDAALIMGDLGKTVPMRDPEATVAAWNALLDLPAAGREELRRKVRDRAVSEFGLDACSAKYQKIYEDLVNR